MLLSLLQKMFKVNRNSYDNNVLFSYSMQERLLFKIDYICKIPWGGGGEQGHFWLVVYNWLPSNKRI